MRTRLTFKIAYLLLAALIGGPCVSAQEVKSPTTPDALEARIKALEARSDTADIPDYSKTISAYQEALTFASDRRTSASKATDFIRKASEAPKRIESLSAEAAPLQDDEQPPSRDTDANLAEASEKLALVNARLDTVRSASQARATEEVTRGRRIERLPELIAKATASLAELPEPTQPAASASELERAEFERATARRELLKQQIATYQAELDYYQAASGIFAAEAAVEAQRIAALTKSAAAWQKLADKLRLAEADAAVEEATEDVRRFQDNPAAKEIAAESLSLARQRSGKDGLSWKIARAARKLVELEVLNDRAIKQHASARRRVSLIEEANLQIDPTTGRLLRQQRDLLPPQNELISRLRDTLQDSAQAQIDMILIEDRQAEVMSAVVAPETSPELLRLREARQGHFKNLIDDYRSYLATLTSTATTLRNLSRETVSFAQFVDERLLWMPSTHPIGADEPMIEAGAVAELLNWKNFAPIWNDVRSWLVLWAFAALLFTALLLRKHVYLRRLAATGQDARRRNCTSYKPTVKALAYTLLAAAPFPFLFWFLYARCEEMPQGIAEGIRNSAGFLTFTILFFRLTHPQGLMIDHFRMTEERVSILRRNLRWFVPAMVPLVFFTTALPQEASASSAGRLFFIGTLVGLLVFFYQVMRPARGLVHWRGRTPNRVASFSYVISLAAPVLLILGAATGYYDSVRGLRIQALITVWIVLFTLFVAAMLYRWILVSRRRLAVQQALKRRAAILAERTASEADPAVATPDEVKAEAVKVVEVEEQTVRLVRAAAVAVIAFGIWGIWRPTIPALSALDKITIWEEKGGAETTSPPAGDSSQLTFGNPVTDATETSAPERGIIASDGRVTLQDLAASMITLLLTFVAANNIPGLLELTIFRRLSLQPGSSFALTTTFRYVIVVAGLVVALGLLGITWSKVQWIAAAITLGIGFGLQEIFANFVAGLIILFERPVRLGDVVTVGDVSGRVSQIRIRATTIRQFNNRELIVPNKEFITGQLVNWTLSDSVLRLEIPVGIAYGSDTEKAREILLQIARENGKVLAEPAPDVLFDSFGDSSLGFQLRGFVSSVENLLTTRTELHYAIDAAFRKAGIEIAFPQTDLHIRSMPAAAVKA